MGVAATGESDEQLGLDWLLRLRWGAVAGQSSALLFVAIVLGIDLPYASLLGLIAFTAVTNAILMLLPNRANERWRLPAVLVTDIAVLTLMLAKSGAAANPFTVFFLVHVALAALLLPPRLAWTLVLLTVVAFASLFFVAASSSMHHEPGMHHGHGGEWSAHLIGMWVAYALSAAFVAHFVGKVSRAIRDHDRKLLAISKLAAQNERLATLSSFSANAAHELGSPLATIGLAAKEIALAIEHDGPKASLQSDAQLICREVARSREILAALSSRAGESVGEIPVRTTPRQIVQELMNVLPPQLHQHVRVRYANETVAASAVVAPVRTLTQMLHNLIRNAFDAQEDACVDSPIDLNVRLEEQLSFHILDRGAGLHDSIRARLGEPFVTTKSAHGGLGLGLYLAQAYAERTGGHLRFGAREGGGTDVELCMDRDALGRSIRA
ncbi:MAG: HAMP domain-containing histidine kinase [Sandaracinaceae bacterium]|nr:HAMP domain-containing histidine kinase [Sandaracinaceae bacterium]